MKSVETRIQSLASDLQSTENLAGVEIEEKSEKLTELVKQREKVRVKGLQHCLHFTILQFPINIQVEI